MVDETSDPLSGGRWLLRAMSEQSGRAQAFNRQMLWFRLRRQPLEPEPEGVVPPDAGQPTIDLTASAEQAVPRQRG